MLLFALLGGVAQAATECADTAAALQQQLDDFSDGGLYANEDNLLAIVGDGTSVYVAPGPGGFHYSSTSTTTSLQIIGGYAAGCTQRTDNAALTRLSGTGTTPVLSLKSTHGLITVYNLTLQDGQSTQPGAGLQVNRQITPRGQISLANLIVRNNHSSASSGGIYAATDVALDLSRSLIVGNSAAGQYGAGIVSSTSSSFVSQLLNVTVSRNTSGAPSNPVGGMDAAGGGVFEIYDGIFWNNTGTGLYLETTQAMLQYNDYGVLGGTAPQSNFQNYSVNPRFVDAAAGNFHLDGNSPLLGISVYATTLQGYADLDGNLGGGRGKADLGAYFETIFIDGFD